VTGRTRNGEYVKPVKRPRAVLKMMLSNVEYVEVGDSHNHYATISSSH
jgi:hypothetical protein